MSFCPYCKEIVGNGVTECPSCGMSWAGAEQAPPAPRIVNEQPLPPQQPAYQQPPPQQPQYQQPPPQQYQQPPPQPQYQQPPPQQYQQPQPQYRQAPPPQQQYQQPPQQYQQPYQQPYAPPRAQKKVGVGSMLLAMIGGVGALLASFVFFMQVSPNDTVFQTLWDLLDGAPDEYLYVWMIPAFGLLAIVLALIGFAAQSKGAGYLIGLLGIIVLILPLVFAFHLSTDYETPIQEIFYSSADTAISEGMWSLFLGGFMAMSAGLMMIGGGFGLAKRIGRAKRPVPQQYYR